MVNGLFSSIQSTLSDGLYYSFYGYELAATSQNLQWALRQPKNSILQFKFKEGSQTYSTLEFAIKSGDILAVNQLLTLQVPLDVSPASGGSILHFYVDCLQAETSPDMLILTALLEKGKGLINHEDADFHTALERALIRMAHYPLIHWGVVAELLKAGSRIINPGKSHLTPFAVLRECDAHKVILQSIFRSFEEEKNALTSLKKYRELEKACHPHSKSTLSTADFKCHATSFFSKCREIARIFATNSLSKSQEEKVEPAVYSSDDLQYSQIRTENLKKILELRPNEPAPSRAKTCMLLAMHIRDYHGYFQSLVEVGSFTTCFEPWVLKAILPAMEHTLREYPTALVVKLCLTSYGLCCPPPDPFYDDLHN